MPFPYVFPVPFAGTPLPYSTTGEIINAAAEQLGLSASADPMADTDPNFIRLRSLLNALGRKLWKERRWTQLTKEHVFTTVGGDNTYPLPDDFGFLLPQSGWDRTSRVPLGGPMYSEEWQWAKGTNTPSMLRIQLRQWQQQLFLYPDSTLPDAREIAFEYQSRWWVQEATAAAPNQERIAASSDIVWFDADLLVLGIRKDFLRALGFPSQAIEDDYRDAFELAAGIDSPAPLIRLDGRMRAVRLIDGYNLPLTGWGL